MDVWRVASHPETGGFTHELPPRVGHGLLVPIVSAIFQRLRVSASVFQGNFWWPMHSEPDLTRFELGHDVEARRYAYNAKMVAEVLSTKQPVQGEYGGHFDAFVPVLIEGRVAAILVSGPFGLTRPTSASILSAWRSLTGRQGHPADPQFMAYLRASLSKLVLEGRKAGALRRLMRHLAELMAGSGRADEITNRANALELELEEARFVEGTWEAARSMVDEQSASFQFSASSAYQLGRLGLMRSADQALVGLAASHAPALDPVEEIVRGDALQRAAVELARSEGNVISGQVGDHGLTFLFGAANSAQERKKRVSHIVERATQLARRRFGISLHFGAGPLSAGPLTRSYQVALGAAELALTRKQRLVFGEGEREPGLSNLRRLRERLTRLSEEQAGSLSAEFDSYLEALAAHVTYRFEPARAELSICFELLAETLLRAGALDHKSCDALRERLDRSVTVARTTSELFAAYRTGVSDLVEAIRRPVVARQHRGLDAALDYVQQHYSEALRVEKVARISGFAPVYFSELFKKREKTTFEKYVFKLRLERAKRLLSSTDLDVRRVAELSGYASSAYLCRVFRRAVGVTPLEYRKGILPEWFRKAQNAEEKSLRRRKQAAQKVKSKT